MSGGELKIQVGTQEIIGLKNKAEYRWFLKPRSWMRSPKGGVKKQKGRGRSLCRPVSTF